MKRIYRVWGFFFIIILLAVHRQYICGWFRFFSIHRPPSEIHYVLNLIRTHITRARSARPHELFIIVSRNRPTCAAYNYCRP